MVSDILLDEAVAVVAADDRIGQMHVFDFGLQLAPMTAGDLSAEDDCNLVRPANRAIGIKQTFAERV